MFKHTLYFILIYFFQNSSAFADILTTDILTTDILTTCFKQDGDTAEQQMLNALNSNYYQKSAALESHTTSPEQRRLNISLRNTCLNTLATAANVCAAYKCLQRNNAANLFINPYYNRNLTGEEICNLINPEPCLSTDLSSARQHLVKYGDCFTDMTFFDMDNTIQEILSGKSILKRIDTNPEACFSNDNNGDTIWHAFVRQGYNMSHVGNLCLSVIPNEQKQFLYDAAFLHENDTGQTAFTTAISLNRLNAFDIFQQYFYQENIDCHDMINYIIQEYNIDPKILQDFCPSNSN